MLPPQQFISCLQSIKIKNLELYLEKLEIELETLGRNRKKLIYDRHFLIQSCEIRRYFSISTSSKSIIRITSLGFIPLICKE